MQQVSIALRRASIRVYDVETGSLLHSIQECEGDGLHLESYEVPFLGRVIPVEQRAATFRTWSHRFELLRSWLKSHGCRVKSIKRVESLRESLDEMPVIQDASEPTVEQAPDWLKDRDATLRKRAYNIRVRIAGLQAKIDLPDGTPYKIGSRTSFMGERTRAIAQAALNDAQADLARVERELHALRESLKSKPKTDVRATVLMSRSDAAGVTLKPSEAVAVADIVRTRGAGLFSGVERLDLRAYPVASLGCRF